MTATSETRYETGDDGRGSLFRRGRTWYARVRVGTGASARTYHKSARDKEGARAALAFLVARHKDGKAVSVPGTFLDAKAGIHADFKAQLGERTYAREKGRVDRIVTYFGDRRVDTITPADVTRFLDGLTDARRKRGGKPTDASPVTRARFRSCLSFMFAHCIEAGYATSDPTRVKVARKSGKGARARVQRPDHGTLLTDAEVDRIVACATTPRARDDGFPTLLRVLSDAGLRRSEALALSWADVNLSAVPMPILEVRHSKSGEPRHVPLTRAATDALRAWRDHSRTSVPLRGPDLVFPLLARPGMESSVSLRFKRAARRAGVAGRPAKDGRPTLPRLHDLRHTFCSRLVVNGAPLSVVQQLAGHLSLQTTLRYARHAPTDLRYAAVAGIDRAREVPAGVTNGATTRAASRASGSGATSTDARRTGAGRRKTAN